MALANNATCSICGKPYYRCNFCKDYKNLYPWKLHTDTSEHFKIYQIIHGYSIGVYDKAETKTKLQNVDLSDLETLRDNIKALIKDIMESDETVVLSKSDNTASITNAVSIADDNTKSSKRTKKSVQKK